MKRKLLPIEQREALLYCLCRPLREYQRPVVRAGTRREAFGLVLDPRLGKTTCDIALSGYRWKRKELRRWLIVAPVAAKYVWLNEIPKVSTMLTKIAVIEGKKDDKRELVKLWRPHLGRLSILIVNPESVWRLRRELLRWDPEKVSLDESHRFKGYSKQARMAISLGRRARFRSILTGTLFNKPPDVFYQFKFLDPTVFGTDRQAFLDRYVAAYGYGGYKPVRFKNLDDLWDSIGSCCYVLKRKDAKGFPEEQVETRLFDLTNPALKHYEEMEKELGTIVREREVRASIVLTQALRLQQITGGFLPTRSPEDDAIENVPLGDDKLRALLGIVAEYPEREPLVIIARYRYEMDRIVAELKRGGRLVGRISGGQKASEREEIRLAFMAGKLDSVVVQIRAAIAISLSRARTAIFYSIPTSLIDYDQARARIADYGEGTIAFLLLAARGTVDEDAVEVLGGRVDLAERMVSRIQSRLRGG